MNDKEYTYDIDKYTIGVDTNGEDGIGLTIAIIKNGEINFLGNCYGENARCLDLLIKENQDLKKQLEEYIKQNMKLKDEYGDYQECNINPLEMKQKYAKQLDNWNKLKDVINQKRDYYRYRKDNRYRRFLSNILDKMQELEGSDNDE